MADLGNGGAGDTGDAGWSRSQAFVTAVIDGMREDILLLDGQGRVIDCNRTVAEHLGMARGDIVGRRCGELMTGDFCRRRQHECPFVETVRTGDKAEAVHTRLNEEGRLEYYRIYTYPVFDDGGKLACVVEIRRDITNRTHTEQRLQQARKMAAIGELSTYIAHEIRNPLFAIGGFARSLLRGDGLDEEARAKVNIILDEARRLDGILKSILNYAKPTESNAREVDVNVVASETAQLMGIGCGQENIVLKTELYEGVAQARGEPELLKQCLINMVKNSMEAMGGDGGNITLTTGMDGKRVFVRVEDNGRGIPDDVKLRVFNPFFSTKDEGSGLGLAMTKKIVEDVGGSIRLVSSVGVGTTVTIWLQPALAVDRNGAPTDDGDEAQGESKAAAQAPDDVDEALESQELDGGGVTS